MAKFTTSRRFDATPENTFDILTDLSRAVERIRGIVKVQVLTDGPIGVGTRWNETRIVFKRECTEELEITEFDAPSFFRVEADSCGCRYRTDFTITPDSGGANVELMFAAQPLTLMAKLMAPLGKLMMKSCAKAFEQDLDDLQAAAEGRSPQGLHPTPA